jgi:hypothetical protein
VKFTLIIIDIYIRGGMFIMDELCVSSVKSNQYDYKKWGVNPGIDGNAADISAKDIYRMIKSRKNGLEQVLDMMYCIEQKEGPIKIESILNDVINLNNNNSNQKDNQCIDSKEFDGFINDGLRKLTANTVFAMRKMSQTQQQVMTNILNKYQGIFIGETHTDRNAKQIIIDNMKLFRKLGVNFIFMEQFASNDAQPLLDRYFEKGDNEMEIRNYLKDSWRLDANDAYFPIIKEARKANIRIVAIDTRINGAECWAVPLRNENMVNKIKQQIINPQEKYIVFAGSNHSGNYPAYKGIDYLLKIPSINVISAPLIKHESKSVVLGDNKKCTYYFY